MGEMRQKWPSTGLTFDGMPKGWQNDPRVSDQSTLPNTGSVPDPVLELGAGRSGGNR